MHLRSLPTMERISVPVRRHPEHYFVVQRSVRLIAIILYQGYNTLKQGLFLIKAVTALLRESHTLNKAVTAVFTSKAAARYKAVIVLRHTTALLRDPYWTDETKDDQESRSNQTLFGNKYSETTGITYLYLFFWAISKNGYTRSVWSQKRVQSGIKSKMHSTNHAIGQKQIVPVFQRL